MQKIVFINHKNIIHFNGQPLLEITPTPLSDSDSMYFVVGPILALYLPYIFIAIALYSDKVKDAQCPICA